jgi:hypothetical protein
VHDRDPLLFHDGFVLSFRNGETVQGCGDMGHCPNQFCSNRTATVPAVDILASGADNETGGSGGRPDDARADYSTLVWIYVWPNTEYSTTHSGLNNGEGYGSADSGAQTLTERLAELKELLSNGLISEEEHALGRRAALSRF